MTILNFLRYLRNFIIVRVDNGFTERFINLCSKEKISLWNIEYHNDGIIAGMYANDFNRLRKIRKKSGVNIRIIKKCGALYSYRKHKRRRVLIFGMLVCIVMMFIMNYFVWSISINGSDNLSSEQIMSAVNEAGLKTGVFVPMFNESEAQRKVINFFDGKIIWMSVNIKGSRATVNVRDYIKPEEEKEHEKIPCNYMADFEGILLNAETYTGEQKAFSGDSVKEGSLLISGIYENTDGSVNYIATDGNFTAIRKRSLSVDYKEKVAFEKLSVQNKILTVEFFHLKAPPVLFKRSKEESFISYDKYISFKGEKLPIGFRKIVNQSKINTPPAKVPLIYFVDSFTSKEYESLLNSRILSSDYKITKNQESFRINGNYDCIDYIGKKVIIVKEN